MTIKQKQNEVELLEVQYSARTLYNIAEGLNIGAWIIAVLWAIFESYIAEGCGITITYMLIINMSIIIITIFFQAGVRSCTKYAAGLRMYFDYQLFGWESEEYQECSKQSLKDIVYKILSLRKKDSAIRMRNTGIQNPRGVKDWYTS